MKRVDLDPRPERREAFSLRREKFVPTTSGCYVLTTFSEEVLYVGLAKNLRQRMNDHLDNDEKRALTGNGRAIFFYWLERDDIEKVERTWMNTHIQYESTLPILNKVFSPT